MFDIFTTHYCVIGRDTVMMPFGKANNTLPSMYSSPFIP